MSSRRLHLSPLPNGVAIVAALIAGGAVEACHIPTEIILVIDTNLTNYDVDQVSIAITGSQTKTIEISVAAAPPFPWALGLEPGGGAGAVEVSVAASLQGSPVLQKTAQTDFVDDEERMLRMLLLDACVGVSCPGTTSPQTCNAGACVSAEVSGTSLPAWTGSVPARPKPAAPIPVDGRTIWADGWHGCANQGSTASPFLLTGFVRRDANGVCAKAGTRAILPLWRFHTSAT